jgi:arylsulfatase A-like enzyme
MARLASTSFELEYVDPRNSEQRPLATRGWYAGVVPQGADGWLVAADAEALLWVPASRDDLRVLDLLVRKPLFLDGPLELAVALNGRALGEPRGVTGEEHVRFELPAGLLHRGLNRLVLRSSPVTSAAALGVGTDSWCQGVEVREVRLEDPSAGRGEVRAGRAVEVRVPPPGQLVTKTEGPLRLVVQDCISAATLFDEIVEGELRIDLNEAVGSLISIAVWPEDGQDGELRSLALATREPLPSLVLIVVDTLRFDAVTTEARDLDPARAPALAALARDGFFFSQSFSAAPMTLPSHATLFTSRPPHATGIGVNGLRVPHELELLAEWLSGCGYHTQGTGSLATLWNPRADEGLDQGFDDFRSVERDSSSGPDSARLFQRQLAGLATGPELPAFLFVHFADPHEPYRDFASLDKSLAITLDGEELAWTDPKHAPHLQRTFELEAGDHELTYTAPDADFVLRSLYLHVRDGASSARIPFEYVAGKRLEPTRGLRVGFHLDEPASVALESWVTDHPSQAETPARYAAEVRLADNAIATIVTELKARGLYDSSLVIFTSDHGEAFGEHQLNGHSFNLYDELLHVPLIVKPPTGARFQWARDALAERVETLVRHVDLTPTALQILGLPPLPGSMGESLAGSEGKQQVLLAETHKPEADSDLYCLRDPSWKLIFDADAERFSLFDLTGDPGELHDVFADRGADFTNWQAELRAVAAAWQEGDRRSAPREGSAPLDALGY